MRSKLYSIGSGMVVLCAIVAMTACERGPQAVDAQLPSLSVSTNDRSIMAGETTTIFANTTNLLGRRTEIEWSTTLGDVEEGENGRMARFSSDQPGTAVVTAELNVDGRVIRDTVNIMVNPIE